MGDFPESFKGQHVLSDIGEMREYLILRYLDTK